MIKINDGTALIFQNYPFAIVSIIFPRLFEQVGLLSGTVKGDGRVGPGGWSSGISVGLKVA
jgi:hypothetical protein